MIKKKRGRRRPQSSWNISTNANDMPRARYVRIQLYGEQRILSLAEVEVFGSEPGTTPRPEDRCKALPGPGEAMIFSRPNYRGECGKFKYKDDPRYPYSVAAEFKDPRYFATSGITSPFYSIKVGSGIVVTLCTQKNLKGNCMELKRDSPILPGFSRGVQSVKIFPTNPKKYVSPITPNDDQVTACETRVHGGGCRKVGQGDYDFKGLTKQSLMIGKNVKVQIYFERNFYGTSRTISYTGRTQRTPKFKSMRVLSINESRVEDKFRRPAPTPIPASTPAPVATPTATPAPTPEQPKVVGFKTQPIGGEGYTGPDSSYKMCAKEGENCRYMGEVKIAYGVGEKFSIRTLNARRRENIRCTNANFGDPAPRLPKRCYIKLVKVVTVNHAPPSRDYTFCVDEPYRCNFNFIGTVAFGVNGYFAYKRGVERGITCNVESFGKDPAPGIPKKCYTKFERRWVRKKVAPNKSTKPSPPGSGYRVCATEGQSCRVQGTGTVAFGYSPTMGGFKYKRNVRGTIQCKAETFGAPKNFEKPRACYVKQN
ncbi:MAG: hypothetical protein HKN33_05885 [Pyrinomonadaceae bacterium]|nr:hypothetical protein [Pyrinomonadaceae bacterium]